MDINYIKRKFLEYGFIINNYETNSSNSLVFFKKNMEISFKKAPLDGWELYLKYLGYSEIKIDFTLEVFSHNKKIEDIVKFFKGGIPSQNDHLSYLFLLLFKDGDFLVNNQTENILSFINWYNKNSEFYYSEFLKKNS